MAKDWQLTTLLMLPAASRHARACDSKRLLAAATCKGLAEQLGTGTCMSRSTLCNMNHAERAHCTQRRMPAAVSLRLFPPWTPWPQGMLPTGPVPPKPASTTTPGSIHTSPARWRRLASNPLPPASRHVPGLCRRCGGQHSDGCVANCWCSAHAWQARLQRRTGWVDTGDRVYRNTMVSQ